MSKKPEDLFDFVQAKSPFVILQLADESEPDSGSLRQFSLSKLG